MILITSMGGCASTSVIGWSSRRIKCNCPLNSEGLAKAGAGSNPRGLKHRNTPPNQSDEYLRKENSFNRDDINTGPISRAVFLYDNPHSMVLSLFRRSIAMGHAMAVTGKKPPHSNDLQKFLDVGEDTFGFMEQFNNWTDKNLSCEYPRLLVKFDSLWENLDYIFGYMGIPAAEVKFFLKRHDRADRMSGLSDDQRNKLMRMYSDLNDAMNGLSGVELIK